MSGSGETGFDLGLAPPAGRQCALGGDPAGGDEERARMAGFCGRHDETARDGPHPRESIELVASLLERLQPVAQPAGVLVAARLRQLGEPTAYARQRERWTLELARVQSASSELRAAPRPDRTL